MNNQEWKFEDHSAKAHLVRYGYKAKCSCGWEGKTHRTVEQYGTDSEERQQEANNDASNHVLANQYKDWKSSTHWRVGTGHFVAYSLSTKNYLAKEDSYIGQLMYREYATVSTKEEIQKIIDAYDKDDSFQIFEICLESL